MAKSKATDKTKGAPDTTGVVTGDDTAANMDNGDNVVHIARGPWDIDKRQVKEIQEISPSEVMVIMQAGASYRLSREEAQPLLP